MKRLFCLLISSLIIISCQLNPFLGVGSTVDTAAPILNIVSHENFQYVSGTVLELHGTCSDNVRVISVLLKVEYKDKTLFTWEIKNPTLNKWHYSIQLNPNADITEQLNAGTAAEKFELPDGEYKFTVFAYDANGNTSNDSYDSRTLVIDNEPSVSEITYPPLKTSLDFYVGEENRGGAPGADPYDYNNSEFFRNGDFYIQGNVDDNYGIASLILTLTEYDGEKEVTEKKLSVTLDSSMKFTVNSNIKKELLEVDEEKKPASLWNWKIYFRETAKEEDDKVTPRYYKVSVTVKDSAGNKESSDKGFFCVLPKMDYPYTIFPGYGEKIPVGTPLSGTSYDDDGIQSVKLSLCNVSGEVIEGKEDIYSEDIAGSTIYTWKMDKSKPATGGAYILKVEVVDIYNKTSSYTFGGTDNYIHDALYRERQLNVVDLTAPSVDISAIKGTDEKGKKVDFDVYSDVVDKSGNFLVSVNVSDASQVCKVYMARVLASADQEDVAKLNEVDPKSGNIKQWNLEEDIKGITFYNLYEYSTVDKASAQISSSRQFNVYDDFEGEFAAKRFYVYAENASGKTTVSYKTLLKEEESPNIKVTSPEREETLSIPFGISFSAADFTGIKDLTITCSQNGKDIGNAITLADLKEIDPSAEFAADKGVYKTISAKMSSDNFADESGFVSGLCTLIFTAVDCYGNTQIETLHFFIDKDDPYIKNVTASKVVATYKTGDTINIRVEMNKPVIVNGKPILTLNNGKTVNFSEVNGNVLIFNYTVAKGDDTERLDCTKLDLNGAQISDGQKELASDFHFPTGGQPGSLEANAVIKIDTKAPTVLSVKSLTSSGSYKAGDKIEIQVIFSENVEIVGTPQLSLNVKDDGAYAQYDSSHAGNGKDKAVFVYTVQEGDNTDGLALKGWNANGAEITDSAKDGTSNKGNQLDFSTFDEKLPQKLVIDTTKPTVQKITSSFTSASLSDGGCYDGTNYYCNEGKYISLEVTFSEIVKVLTSDATPLSLSLSSGGTADYSSGSGSNKLIFAYTVGRDDTTKGAALAVTGINGTIKDAAGNDLAALSNGIIQEADNDAPKNLIIDTERPAAPTITLPTANVGKETPIYTALNDNGKTVGVIVKAGGIAADTYSYCWEENGIADSYTVYNQSIEKTFGDNQEEGFYQEYSVKLRLKDKAGNESDFAEKKFIIDTSKPKLTKASSSAIKDGKLETSGTGTYVKGEKINISLVFNKKVTVTKDVKVTLSNNAVVTLGKEIDHIEDSADYYLSGTYTVGDGETYDTALRVSSISGTVKDDLDNTLDLTRDLSKESGFENIDTFQAITIDSVAPTIDTVSSTTTHGWYTEGKFIPITVGFSEAVTFTGSSPVLTLSNDAKAYYISGSGTATWMFMYEVRKNDENDESTGDSSKDESYLTVKGITGTITDLAGVTTTGNKLNSSIPQDNNFKNQKIGIDTILPKKPELTAAYQGGVVNNKDTISGDKGDVTVSLSSLEPGADVYITRNDEVQNGGWTNAAGSISVTCQPGNNENITYKITAKQRDRAGNVSEEDSITFTIDNTNIILGSITTDKPNGQYTIGAKIPLMLNFNKEVKVTEQLTLTLNATNADGKNITVSVGQTSEFSQTITANYIVREGDTTPEVLNVLSLAGTVNGKVEGNSLNFSDSEKFSISTITNLIESKSITIDTIAPTLDSITTSSADGWYKAGDQIAITLNFSEDVKIGSENPTLEMSSKGTAVYNSQNGQTMIFVYTVGTTDTTGSEQDLKVMGIIGNITDMAGNKFGNTIPSANFNDKKIGIDTFINKITFAIGDDKDPKDKSFLGSVKLTIGGLTDSGSKLAAVECTVNGKSEVLSIDNNNGTATIECDKANGVIMTYAVTVKMTDKAGNVSSESVSFKIDGEDIQLESITTQIASDTYKAGTVIPIELNFNKEVKVTETLTLTLSNNKTVTVVANNSSSQTITANYTVQSGDDCQSLKVTGITGAVNDGNRTSTFSNFDLAKVTNITNVRTIHIDTIAPKITEITTTVGDGWYNAGKIIRFTVECDEIVTVSGAPVLNLSNGSEATYISGSGTKNLAFNYVVANGDSTGTNQNLTVSGYTGDIKDSAKNELSFGSPATDNKMIGIDTAAPATLTIGGIANNGTVIDAKGLTISGFGEKTPGSGIKSYTVVINSTSFDSEPSTATNSTALKLNNVITETKSYTVILNSSPVRTMAAGNGTQTLTFEQLSKEVQNKLTVSAGGKQTFSVSAYQTDNAGNNSAASENLTFTVDANQAKLLSVTSSKSSQTCKEGDTVEISLVFSRAANRGESPSVKLSNEKDLTSGKWSTDGTTYTVTYTVGTAASEDTGTDNLTIKEITGKIKDELAEQQMSGLWSNTPALNLSSYNVKVDTKAPTAGAPTYRGETLTYTFSENVQKVAGKKLTLTREAYAAPIVLTPAEYNEYVALAGNIAGYYERTINGSDNKGTVDSIAKYVLKYEYDPTNSGLVNYFNTIGYYKQEIVMESSDVAVSGNTVTVTIKGLMTGETYTVTTEKGIVKDSVGHDSPAVTTASFSSGDTPQPPVIRINKISGRGTTANKTTFKVNTVTKGATVYYSKNSTASPGTSYKEEPVTWRGTTYTGVSIDSTSIISARAVKGSVYSATVYEKAFKTTIKSSPKSTDYSNNNTIRFYAFRGGDQLSGSNSVANFPLTWDEKSVPATWSYSTVDDALETQLAQYGMLLADNKQAITWSATGTLYFHGLGCRVSDNKLQWKWQEGSPAEVTAGSTGTDEGKLEANFHDSTGGNY